MLYKCGAGLYIKSTPINVYKKSDREFVYAKCSLLCCADLRFGRDDARYFSVPS